MKRPIRTEGQILAEDRARIDDILSSPEGLRNPKLARELAVVAGMPKESALGILRSVPAANPYLQAMDAEGSVGLTGPSTLGAASDPRAARMAEIKAAGVAYNATRGYARD